MGRRTRIGRNLAVIRTVKADPKATARCGLSRTVPLARPVVHAKDYAMRKMIMKATARPAVKGIVTMARHPLAVKHRVMRKMITRDIARHGPTVIVPTARHAVNVQSHGVVSQVRKVWKVAARRCLMKIDRQARRAIIVRGSMMRKTIARDIVLQDPKEIVPMARLMASGLKPVAHRSGDASPEGQHPPRPEGDRPDGPPRGDRPERRGYPQEGEGSQGHLPPRPEGERPDGPPRGDGPQAHRPRGGDENQRPPRPEGDRRRQGRPAQTTRRRSSRPLARTLSMRFPRAWLFK